MKTESKQQFTIQTGAINITTYQQEGEAIDLMLDRAFNTYKEVKKRDDEGGLGLLAYRKFTPSAKPAKPSWKEGDLEPKCPLCKSDMRRRDGKFGSFWGCTKYPECKGTIQVVGTKPEPASEAEVNALVDDMSA